MPTGIILKSASHEVSDEQREKNLKAVVENAGFEVAKSEEEEKASVVEPDRKNFKTEEEFEAAHVAWQDAQKSARVEEEDEEEEEIQATAPKKKSRKERAVERATEQLQKELKEAKERLAALEAKKEPQSETPKEQVRPKRADFANDEAYEDALLAWGTQKALTDKALKDAENANKSRFEQNIQNYAAQVEEAKEEHEDWDEVVNQDIFIGKEVQLAILEQENGAEVIYYLGKHPAYSKKLGEMSPLSAVMEVGRLSAKLNGGTGASARDEANDGEPAKPKPKVPAPVKTVSTAGSSATPTFAEIAARPNYPGKAKDLRLASAAGR